MYLKDSKFWAEYEKLREEHLAMLGIPADRQGCFKSTATISVDGEEVRKKMREIANKILAEKNSTPKG